MVDETPAILPSNLASPKLELLPSRQFPAWLQEQQISLAVTTYQAGKLMLVGCQPSGRLSVFERTFNRCMGLWSDGQAMWMTSLFQLWRLENALTARQQHEGYDRLYVPRVGYTTGDIDIHDLAVDHSGRVIFVNTLFSCLATVSETHSFVPIWIPPFVTKLAAEDRCHLNGLAMEHGHARYVTAVAATDAPEAWREHRNDGGVVIDCQSKEIVARGLSMPHSPRIYRNQLWLLDAGTGYFGRIDRATGKFEPLTFCPGFLRGLSFVGDFAVIATSQVRDNKTLTGLRLDKNLSERGAEARCQVAVIDLRTFDLVHSLRFSGAVEELYDVIVLPGVRRPMALGFKTGEIRRTLSVADMQELSVSGLSDKGGAP
jgi:uncharacterized protein (TIGR03032 family)